MCGGGCPLCVCVCLCVFDCEGAAKGKGGMASRGVITFEGIAVVAVAAASLSIPRKV